MLSIGRLLYWKGFQYAIQACAELKRRGVSFEYRIVGWGPFENNLLTLIRKLNLSSCVLLAGRMTNEEVLDKEMARAHVLLHPALHESFGNVCLEALACGRPVVCLNVGGPASQVTPACGYAVSVESPQRAVIEIADAVEGLFSSPDKWQQMSAAARARATRYFSLEILERRIQKAYADLQGEGMGGLHYVEGASLLGADGEDTVDGSHPTDLGFKRQADALYPVLKALLS